MFWAFSAKLAKENNRWRQESPTTPQRASTITVAGIISRRRRGSRRLIRLGMGPIGSLKSIIMKKVICIVLLTSLSTVVFAEESFAERGLDNYIKDNFDDFILYADIVLLDADTNETEKYSYLLNVSDGNGIIITMRNDGQIINAYDFSYNNIRKVFLLGDIHGCVWSINKARNVLDNIFNVRFKIIQGKDIKKKWDKLLIRSEVT